MILRNAQKEVFVVGTAHVSRQSAQQVRDVIEAAKPDSVVVELCEERAGKLRARMAGRKEEQQGRKDDFEAMAAMLKGLVPGRIGSRTTEGPRVGSCTTWCTLPRTRIARRRR